MLAATTLRAGDLPGDWQPSDPQFPDKNPAMLTTPVVDDMRPLWRVSTGATWRNIGDVRFNTGSRSQHLALPILVGREFHHLPHSAGRLDELGSREYDNGFVRSDAGTGRDGTTWNWGYQDAQQIQGDQIIYSLGQGSQRSISRSIRLDDASWLDGNESDPGPYIEIERLTPITRRLSAGPQVNFSFINLESQHSGQTFSQHQEGEKRGFLLTDRFDLDGVIPPLAPYAGSEAGPGPVINNLPSIRAISSHSVDRRTTDFYNRVDERFDLDLSTIGVGVQVEYDLGAVFIQTSAGLSVNIADWDASHYETLYLSKNGGEPVEYRRWREHENGTDLLLGAYLQTKVGVQLTERISAAGFVRYDWNESLTGSVGPSSFKADLDNLSAGVTIGFTF